LAAGPVDGDFQVLPGRDVGDECAAEREVVQLGELAAAAVKHVDVNVTETGSIVNNLQFGVLRLHRRSQRDEESYGESRSEEAPGGEGVGGGYQLV
jgi:hypothetical protein